MNAVEARRAWPRCLGGKIARLRESIMKKATSGGISHDIGSASIWLLGVGLAVTSLAFVVTVWARDLVESHGVKTAADLGALAGALEARQGETVACERARTIVEANGARMAKCCLVGLDLVVTAEGMPPGVGRTIQVTARAGPIRLYSSQGATLDG